MRLGTLAPTLTKTLYSEKDKKLQFIATMSAPKKNEGDDCKAVNHVGLRVQG